MAFHEIRFPVDISYGSRGGPGYNTSIIILGSGYEQRNINWENSRSKYDVAYGVKTSTQLDDLIAFFRARYGKAHGFRYKDWADFESSGEPCITISSSAATYQLNKRYDSGSYYYDRELTKITSSSSGILKIFRDASQVSTTGYSVDVNTGIVTLTSVTTQSVTADCEFDVPVRFDTDELLTSLDNYNPVKGYFGGASVPVIEIKV